MALIYFHIVLISIQHKTVTKNEIDFDLVEHVEEAHWRSFPRQPTAKTQHQLNALNPASHVDEDTNLSEHEALCWKRSISSLISDMIPYGSNKGNCHGGQPT